MCVIDTFGKLKCDLTERVKVKYSFIVVARLFLPSFICCIQLYSPVSEILTKNIHKQKWYFSYG